MILVVRYHISQEYFIQIMGQLLIIKVKQIIVVIAFNLREILCFHNPIKKEMIFINYLNFTKSSQKSSVVFINWKKEKHKKISEKI